MYRYGRLKKRTGFSGIQYRALNCYCKSEQKTSIEKKKQYYKKYIKTKQYENNRQLVINGSTILVFNKIKRLF
jgi:ribosomal protein L25 (general stress protein Ctc)